MSEIEITEEGNIIEFRGRGLVSSEPDVSNIVELDRPTSLETTEEPLTLDISDDSLIIVIEQDELTVETIGIQGPAGRSEDSVLDDDKEIDWIDDDHYYKGYAVAGSDHTDPAWKIFYASTYNIEGDTTKRWAEGTAARVHKWSERLTYTY